MGLIVQALFVDCRMPWPLALVLDSQALQLYNAVLVFLLQVSFQCLRGC